MQSKQSSTLKLPKCLPDWKSGLMSGWRRCGLRLCEKPTTATGKSMKLTLIMVGETPAPMQHQFGHNPPQFQKMFGSDGFEFETVRVLKGDPLPDPTSLQGIVITGSAAGVYEDHPWMEPLRTFIRQAYKANIPMLGICFGHQIMADALGGEVRKSEKGWSIGRHVYQVSGNPKFMSGMPSEIAITASHQDQVITAPACATVFLSSKFTPNAGLIYDNGAAISLQPHPEFEQDYSKALVELRRDNPLNDDEVAAGKATLDTPVDSQEVAKRLARFLKLAHNRTLQED